MFLCLNFDVQLNRALLEIKEEPNKLPSSTASNESIEQATETIMDSNGDLTSENNVDRLKSAISIVQEIAQKRDLPIRFVVESETGPAHMKHFIIKCSVGEIEVRFKFIFKNFKIRVKFFSFSNSNRPPAMEIQKK